MQDVIVFMAADGGPTLDEAARAQRADGERLVTELDQREALGEVFDP